MIIKNDTSTRVERPFEFVKINKGDKLYYKFSDFSIPASFVYNGMPYSVDIVTDLEQEIDNIEENQPVFSDTGENTLLIRLNNIYVNEQFVLNEFIYSVLLAITFSIAPKTFEDDERTSNLIEGLKQCLFLEIIQGNIVFSIKDNDDINNYEVFNKDYVTISGRKVKVQFIDEKLYNGNEDNPIYGMYSLLHNSIFVTTKDCNNVFIQQTFIHEYLHALLDTHGIDTISYDEEEKLVDIYSRAFNEILRMNGWFMLFK